MLDEITPPTQPTGRSVEATPRGSPPALPRPGPRGGVPGGPLSPQPRQCPLRVPGRDRPVDRVGILLRPYVLVLHDQQLDMLIRFGVFIPMLVLGYAFTYTPHLQPCLGMDLLRDRRRDHRDLGLLLVADPDAAGGVRLRGRHPDHRLHVHAASPAVHPRRDDRVGRHRGVPARTPSPLGTSSM